MHATPEANHEQSTAWNGPSGRAWVETQGLLDLMFAPFEDLLVQAVRHIAQCAHEQPAGVVGGQLAYEAAVDLQVIDIETLQEIKGTEAGPEIIERKAAAHFLHPPDDPLCPVDARPFPRFRDLVYHVR